MIASTRRQIIIILCLIFIVSAFGLVSGFLLGYHKGIEDTVNFGMAIADKVEIGNFTITLNQTKIDQAIDTMMNLSIQLAQENRSQ